MNAKSLIATLDFETDPFKYGRAVRPFCWDFFDGSTHTTYWGDDCLSKLSAFLKDLRESHIIYAHNGGNFDFMFMLREVAGKMLLINNRIVKAQLGKHQIRDSFAILPVPLRDYAKEDIDYKKLERKVREDNRDEIIRYLKLDTFYLHELVSKYRAHFGDAVTMAGAALKKLQEFHSFERMSKATDTYFRRFYFGGRVECFQRGLVRADVKVFDVNSMYPAVMRSMFHPVAEGGFSTNKIGQHTCFVTVEGESGGAFAVRKTTGGIEFPRGPGIFNTTIHEFEAALETQTFKLKKVHAAWNFMKRICFDEFIDYFYDARMKAKNAGDKAHTLFWKLVMNSAYGKFAQDPRKFCDYQIRALDAPAPEPLCECFSIGGESDECTCNGWSFSLSNEEEGWRVWKKPSPEFSHTFYNVATAASITGAARSILLRAIAGATEPIYCDTDSLICGSLGSGSRIGEKELGAWKLETTGDMIAVCGKKTYAIFDHGKCVKMASKGARLSAREIMAIARGRTVTYSQNAPRFKLDGRQVPIQRRIRATK